ncbi:AAA family ATPase [Devosia sp. 2618]|uniref:AAA family ATPase n=1 Tax=Devosia sp. 2618 TaxID=3156454 RepID=UPI003390FA85
MHTIPPLADLGERIMVLGLTNSGKSTLAEAIGRRTGIPVVHLDQFRHLPNTNWEERSDEAFKELHDAAVATDAWIMDGSYSKVMAPRLERVTGMIVLDESLAVRLRRYLLRSVVQRRRAGGLEGNQDSIRLHMLGWLWKTRDRAEGIRNFARSRGVPHVFCHNQSELEGLYEAWGLTRQD